jgi:hypothetical protein
VLPLASANSVRAVMPMLASKRSAGIGRRPTTRRMMATYDHTKATMKAVMAPRVTKAA